VRPNGAIHQWRKDPPCLLVQDRRDAKAAKQFFKRLLKGLQYVPRVIVTDKLRSYGVAQRHLLPDVEHRQSRYLNNRAENSHRPTRRRERQMQRFKSPRRLRTSSALMLSSMAISTHAAICSQQTPSERSGAKRSTPGTRKPAPVLQHDRSNSGVRDIARHSPMLT
jgi:transposase-like protein